MSKNDISALIAQALETRQKERDKDRAKSVAQKNQEELRLSRESQEYRDKHNPRKHFEFLMKNIKTLESFMKRMYIELGSDPNNLDAADESANKISAKYIVILRMDENAFFRAAMYGKSLSFHNISSILNIESVSILGIDSIFDQNNFEMARAIAYARNPLATSLTMIMSNKDNEIIQFDSIEEAKKSVADFLKDRFKIRQ